MNEKWFCKKKSPVFKYRDNDLVFAAHIYNVYYNFIMFVTILMISNFVSASSLIITYWQVSASLLSMRFQPIWKNFFVFITITKREEFILRLKIMYAYFRQIVFVLVFSQSCEFVMLNELTIIVVLWLNRQLISR